LFLIHQDGLFMFDAQCFSEPRREIGETAITPAASGVKIA
jgi:hypothetical protein